LAALPDLVVQGAVQTGKIQTRLLQAMLLPTRVAEEAVVDIVAALAVTVPQAAPAS